MSAPDAFLLAGAAFLWTLAGSMVFFAIVFLAVLIDDGLKKWRMRRAYKELFNYYARKDIIYTNELILQDTKTASDYFDKVTEYRNDIH